MEYNGTCKYCGQQKIVIAGEGLAYRQADEIATMECDCTEALAYQRMQQNKTYAVDNIKRLFSIDDESFQTVLINLVEPIARGTVAKVSIVNPDGIKATITGKETKIRVERTETIKTSSED